MEEHHTKKGRHFVIDVCLLNRDKAKIRFGKSISATMNIQSCFVYRFAQGSQASGAAKGEAAYNYNHGGSSTKTFGNKETFGSKESFGSESSSEHAVGAGHQAHASQGSQSSFAQGGKEQTVVG